jgi:hypothetical protein
MPVPQELVCSTKDIDEIKTVSKLIYEVAIRVMRKRPLMLRRMAGANVIGDIRLAIGWRTCDVLALFPGDVAWGIHNWST